MERSLERNPLSSAAHSNIALTYHAAGRIADAERACRKALELSHCASASTRTWR